MTTGSSQTSDFESHKERALKIQRRPSMLVLEGPREGCVFPLVHDETLLGRSEECDIQLMHESVSRKHARVYLSNNIHHIRDLESHNGVEVNGSGVSQQELKEGDIIRIGQVVLKFSMASQVEENFWERQQESITLDPLTKIHNRRALQTHLESEWAFAKRHARPLSVVMFDIDHFKKINDEHGHTRGDEVLQAVAASLQSSIRQEDFLARYGGEEFIVILRETERDVAMQLASRARMAVERLKLGLGKSVTLSGGCATLSDDVKSVEWLIKRADSALYAAKEEGRNRCAYFRPPASTAKVER